jgi:Tfp pilus assembly protein PilF
MRGLARSRRRRRRCERRSPSKEDLGKPPGPPAAYKPPHELFGEILLRAGQPAEAVEQFRKNLQRHANRARSLLGLARAESAMGEKAAACTTYGRLLQIWRQADPNLPRSARRRNTSRQMLPLISDNQ